MDEPALPPQVVPRVPGTPRRLLVRLPNWVGDVVMAAPTLLAIHRRHPGVTIVASAKPALLSLAALLPGVGGTIPAGADDGPRALRDSSRRLRAEGFDAALVLPRGIRPLLAPWMASIPVRVGFGGGGRGTFLTHPARGWKPWRRGHRRDWFGLLARAFDAEVDGPLALELPPVVLEGADRLLRALGRRRARPLVVLEPGAAYGPAKCWPAERFGRLAAHLLRQGSDVLTVGTAAARDLEEEVAAGAGEGLLRGVSRTPDLPALAGLLARADLLVSNDTGPMHLAAALGTPTLALFGATDPGVSGPAGPGPSRVLFEPEPCSPCFLRRCPVPGHPCLERFGVERVLSEAVGLLASRPAPERDRASPGAASPGAGSPGAW